MINFESNSELIASTEYKNWPVESDAYVTFLSNPNSITNLTINGSGIIMGNGQIWWPLYKKNELKYRRPNLINLNKMNDVVVSGITMINSPMFHLDLIGCKNVKVFNINITVTTPGYTDAPNTDGIDIGSENVHIYNSFIQNGDDSYVLKGGAYNVLIENSIAQLGLGLDVGTGGNITNATFRNMICKKTQWGIRLKAKGDTQHGNQTNIIFTNITFDEVEKAIDINEFNQSVTNNQAVGWVDISDILFQDIRGTYTDWAGHLDCAKNYPCKDLTFKDINLTAKGTEETWQCSDDVYGTATNVTPELKCLKS